MWFSEACGSEYLLNLKLFWKVEIVLGKPKMEGKSLSWDEG